MREVDYEISSGRYTLIITATDQCPIPQLRLTSSATVSDHNRRTHATHSIEALLVRDLPTVSLVKQFEYIYTINNGIFFFYITLINDQRSFLDEADILYLHMTILHELYFSDAEVSNKILDRSQGK